jgi:hypothetical protein
MTSLFFTSRRRAMRAKADKSRVESPRKRGTALRKAAGAVMEIFKVVVGGKDTILRLERARCSRYV